MWENYRPKSANVEEVTWLFAWLLVLVFGCILFRKNMRIICGWVEENMKKVVARGKEATSPPPVPVEPLPSLALGPPAPRQRFRLLLSFWFLSCLLVNKGDSSISDIVNHCVCVYLIYEKHSSSIFVTLNGDLQSLKIKLWSQHNMGSGTTYFQFLQPIMTSLFVSIFIVI